MRVHFEELPATAGFVRRARRKQRSEDPGISVQPVRWPGINNQYHITVKELRSIMDSSNELGTLQLIKFYCLPSILYGC